MFKEKTIYKWEIEGTNYFVEKELNKQTDGKIMYDYWVGHKNYGMKIHAFGQMQEVPEHLLFDKLIGTIIHFKEEAIYEDDM